MHKDREQILFTQTQIQSKIAEIAQRLNSDYALKSPLVVCVLKGASVFFADIIRALDFDLQIDFVQVSSYGANSVSSGKLALKKDIDTQISGRDIIIVEDIVDSGLTLEFLKNLFESRGANSVKILALLDKKSRRQMHISADYVCFEVDDYFVVGYGLDFDEKYRNLPYIAVLKNEIAQN